MAKTRNKFLLLKLLLFILKLTGILRLSESKNVGVVQEYLNNMVSNGSHLHLQPPADNHDMIYDVNVSVYMQDVFDINEQDSSFTPCFWLVLEWTDIRLKFLPYQQNNRWFDHIQVPIHIAKEKGSMTLAFYDHCLQKVSFLFSVLVFSFSFSVPVGYLLLQCQKYTKLWHKFEHN